MKCLNITSILKKYRDFRPGWKTIRYGGMYNPAFGKVSHVVICKDDGTPIYDQPKIEEQPGSIVLPYDVNNDKVRVGLITQERPVTSRFYIEVPRGFGNPNENALETAYRELFEETGLDKSDVAPLQIIGRLNVNTTYFATAPPIVVARFKRLEEIHNPRGDKFAEKISKVKPYTFDELLELQKKGELEDGITTATLFHFGCFMPKFYGQYETKV